MTRVLILLFSATVASAEGWMQWGANPRHESAVGASGQRLDRIEAEVVIDPFVIAEKTLAGGSLLTHYPVPLVDGDDLFVILKGGSFIDFQHRSTQTWSVHAMRRDGLGFTTRWTYAGDWKPVPTPGGGAGPSWEAVYHPALTADAVWAPGAGGTIDHVSRVDGSLIQRFNPFGTTVDPSIYMAGPPSVDDAGNIYYNAIQLDTSSPWTSDARGAWLVKIAANGTASKVAFSSIVSGAPAANGQCTASFSNAQLPWPPSPTAVAPTVTCGAQRPGVNVAPAIAADGTIYTISRAHMNDRYGYLVAVNPNLTPKWTASLRNRFNDGCNVMIPPNGTPGGCRSGAITGVDPAENQPGSGRVSDNGTSSPVVAPDGRIVYGSYTRYNYSQGHLMSFNPDGTFVASYGWGWDLTPAIWRHDGTYSLLLKENHYDAPAYCSGAASCPGNRTFTTPSDPEQYFITQLNPSLQVEWKFKNTETKSCARVDNQLQCVDDHPAGFEWCVNAVAVDGRGVVYANAEDGNVYAIDQGGTLRERIFLTLALGAAYTPLSIGGDGRIYTQNDGKLFVVGAEVGPRRRAVR